MPVQSNKGIDASLPGGALRLDVNPSEDTTTIVTTRGPSPNVLLPISGAFAMPQYGAEAVMYALNGIGALSVIPATSFAAIPFTNVERDFSQLTSVPQCNAGDGTFTAQHEGFFEVGVQMMYTLGSLAAHVELAIWMDGVGGPGLPLAGLPAAPFGTTSPSGPAWSRIAQRTMTLSLTAAPVASGVADAPGHVMSCSTVWCVHDQDSVVSGNGQRYQTTYPAPLRFRFSVRSDQPVTILGNTALQTRAWMRWLSATAFSG